jgi:hypothetical protein
VTVTDTDTTEDTRPRILQFADFLGRQVPESKFDMGDWLEVPFDALDREATRSVSELAALREVVAPDAADRGYRCVTRACAAGWAVLWAEVVRRDRVAEASIESGALAYLTADLPDFVASSVRLALERMFHVYNYDYAHRTGTPAGAADVLREIAAGCGVEGTS